MRIWEIAVADLGDDLDAVTRSLLGHHVEVAEIVGLTSYWLDALPGIVNSDPTDTVLRHDKEVIGVELVIRQGDVIGGDPPHESCWCLGGGFAEQLV